jgi:hypothetical protein
MTLRGKFDRRLRRWPPRRVFSRFDFLDLGTTAAVGMALKRMLDVGEIRRVKRGYFDRARQHPILGELGPSRDELLKAIARRSGEQLQMHDLTAANELRLSEQVPAQIIYGTNGPTREIDLGGKRPAKLQRQPRRTLAATADVSRVVFSGLRAMGQKHITAGRVAHLRRELKPEHRKRLLKDLPYAPAWMHPFLRQIAGEDGK